MFFSRLFKKEKNSSPAAHYDPSAEEPVIRCSICTGEQVAGFRNLSNGAFKEIMLIRTPADLEDFRKEYGIGQEELPKIY